MPSVASVRPTDIFSAGQWRGLTRVSPWRGLWLVAHAWGVIVLTIIATLWIGHWIAWIPAVAIIAGRQLGLAILMHEAAHGLLHPNRRINNFVGEWLAGAPVGSDLKSYRAYHLAHHRHTQQPGDPDLPLSRPFPTTRASLMRKALRDLTGRTFLKQRAAQFAAAWRGLKLIVAGTATSDPRDTAAVITARATGRFLLAQAVLLALSLLLWGWTPYLLWIGALATVFPLSLRVRNIAEHACTATGPGDPFSHARTTLACLTERALFAPYWVNYHAEHHLFMGVPCYRLELAHRHLIEQGYAPRMTIAGSYAEVIRSVIVPATPSAA
jgi:fatty acid desaturase